MHYQQAKDRQNSVFQHCCIVQTVWSYAAAFSQPTASGRRTANAQHHAQMHNRQLAPSMKPLEINTNPVQSIAQFSKELTLLITESFPAIAAESACMALVSHWTGSASPTPRCREEAGDANLEYWLWPTRLLLNTPSPARLPLQGSACGHRLGQQVYPGFLILKN